MKVEATKRNGMLQKEHEYLPIELLVSKNGEPAFGGIYFSRTDQFSCLRACQSFISNLVDGVRRNSIHKVH